MNAPRPCNMTLVLQMTADENWNKCEDRIAKKLAEKIIIAVKDALEKASYSQENPYASTWNLSFSDISRIMALKENFAGCYEKEDLLHEWLQEAQVKAECSAVIPNYKFVNEKMMKLCKKINSILESNIPSICKANPGLFLGFAENGEQPQIEIMAYVQRTNNIVIINQVRNELPHIRFEKKKHKFPFFH